MVEIDKYSFFELRMKGIKEPTATFISGEETIEIKGFRINEEEMAVRFMPRKEGVWQYRSGELSGEFLCVPNTGNNHGPVVTEGCHFRYVDGSKYCPVGTTCYAWIHQTPELVAQTLETLKKAPFNKIRMCVFPKSMPFNNNDPELYPFHRRADGSWDVSRPDFRFWEHLESNIQKLIDIGIEADLILFHPYDRWGFSNLTHEESLTYINYCIRRLSAYRNIWWSLANEYELLINKTYENWQAIGQKISAEDAYGHLISIHNIFTIFPKNEWMTHCSIQSGDVKKVTRWRTEYDLPVIIDECGYEGNIEFDWGNLSAFEMVHRAWMTAACGGYITHGETFYREDEVLWWAKGGKLFGESVARFAFLKELQYEIGELSPYSSRLFSNPNEKPGEKSELQMNPISIAMSKVPEAERSEIIGRLLPALSSNKDYRLHYFGRSCPSYNDVVLPENGRYRIEVIDIWEMTRSTASEDACGKVKVSLPGKEGIAILVTCLAGENL